VRDEIERLAAELVMGYDASPDWRRHYPSE
jgi:hypothetical protein